MYSFLQRVGMRFLFVGIFSVLLSQSLQAQYPNFSYQVIGTEVIFTNMSQGAANDGSVSWNFGDGAMSNEENPAHFYSTPGTYLIQLTDTFGPPLNAPLTLPRSIVIPDLGNAFHDDVAVQKNGVITIDVLANDGLSATDFDVRILANAVNGSATVSGDNIMYTPNMEYTGWDVVEYEAFGTTDSTLKDTGFVFIDVYDGACGYNMRVTPNWWHCPAACETTTGLQPIGQPTPNGDACFGYSFHLVNAGNETLDFLSATIEVDENMTVVADAIVEAQTTADAEIFNIDWSDNSVHFSLKSGMEMAPNTEYHVTFLVDVTAPSVAGTYHISLVGDAVCATGSGKQVNIVLDDKEGAACDPNAMHVAPEGCGPAGNIDTTVQELVYTIEFENDGFGPADEIIIEQFIPSGLEINSIRVLDGFPFRPEKTINPVDDEVIFFFHDVNLPPASQDSAGSSGFVRYAIDIKSDIADGTALEAWANIFFDSQLPVPTDTTLITVNYAPQKPVIQLPPDLYLDAADTCVFLDATPVGGTSTYTYRWESFGGFTTSSLTVCPFANGFGGVYVTDTNTGCTSYDRWNYIFDDAPFPLSVEEVAQPLFVSVFPNPFRDQATIRLEGETATEIQLDVYNNLGQKVTSLYKGRIAAGQTQDFTFDGRKLPSGIYFYSLHNEQGLRQTGKMILTK